MSRALLGWRMWGYPFEWKARDGVIKLGRGGEAFPFDGPAEARCNPARDEIEQLYNKRLRQERYGGGVRWNPDKISALGTAHTSPDPRCSCGIYAYHDMRYKGFWGGYLVKGWGRYAYGSQSQWRAQYVEPIAISFKGQPEFDRNQGIANKLSENYNIPILFHHQIPLFAELSGLSFDKPE